MNSENASKTLDQIPADRKLIEQLYEHNIISSTAREAALELIIPHNQWGLWASRILLIIGASLILTGIIFFYAYNWSVLTPLIKLGSIEIALVGCLVGAYFYTLNKLIGQVLLLCASVLVGVFMAVFGQIYQTGADAYTLFLTWSIVILGWTLISQFKFQWIVWLGITNTALWLWWDQAALPSDEMKYMIFVYSILLNLTALVLYEYFTENKLADWLQAWWLQLILLFAVLGEILTIITLFFWESNAYPVSLNFAFIFGLLCLGVGYYYYRYYRLQMLPIACIILSLCYLVETIFAKLLNIVSPNKSEETLLLMTLITLGVFAYVIVRLRHLSKTLEARDD